MKNLIGEIYISLSCFLIALATVISHHLINTLHPLVILFYSFLFSTIIISFIKMKTSSNLLSLVAQEWKLVLMVNVSTTVDWMLMFIALHYISGSLVNCFIYGLSPIATVFLSLKTYTHAGQLIKDFIVVTLLSIILFSLSAVYYHHLGHPMPINHLLLGIGLSGLSGIATAVTVLSCKRLHQKGFNTLAVMKSRYGLIIVSAFLIILLLRISLNIGYIPLFNLFMLSLIFVLFPSFLFQKGVEKTTPVLLAILGCLTPIMTYLLQWFEPNHLFQFSELSLIMLLTLLICAATVIKPHEI